jgi:hypothetical protein
VQVPESRHKYLYERLGDHDFQLLINALLIEQFPDFRPLPLRQAEGGRDGVVRAGEKLLISQVKGSVHGRERNPVAWLEEALKDEEDNITRLIGQGATRYILATNVPSTGKPGSGTFDKLDAALRGHGERLGIEMTCLWRETVDAMVDRAPDSVKWTYADMLAGWDLIRYLIDRHAQGQRDRGLRDLVRKVAAAQWDDDAPVKFSQVDIDRERVVDLFVDVTAERIYVPGSLRNLNREPAPVGGAAAYLLSSDTPFTLVRGAPGQGKSTLSQYLCQAHRAPFVSTRSATGELPAARRERFPIRFDLGAYAAWLRGVDVFDPSADTVSKGGKNRPASASTIECFLAELMTHAAGGVAVSAQDVQDLFDRVPSLVVVDGLDEVGSRTTRQRVVDAIDRFCRRGAHYAVPPQVVVTTRPSAGGLPEPSSDLFEVLTLNPLEQTLRDEYLRKWCAVRGIHGRDERDLRASFKLKSAEPYIGELAGNPMQLTILLDLLKQKGAATPTQRTELYDNYMDLLLAREANKHPDSVKKHRADLLEIIPFLGWYLQSRSEERGLSGRMPTEELQAAMRHFQTTYAKPESVVDELFEAATDRMWALTSKHQGSFEFEVVSLREYFAARFPYHYAGEGDRRFDRVSVFGELLRRPYWLNTVRFYGGNATGSDLYVLSGGIRERLSAEGTRQERIAAWTLITDGVFQSRPTEAASVIDALCSEAGATALLEAARRNEISPLPELPSAPAQNPTWTRMTDAIAASPADPDNRARVRVLRELLSERGEFARWWAAHAAAAVGSPAEQAWLDLAAQCEAAAGLQLDLDGVNLAGAGAQRVLNSSIIPPAEGRLEHNLITAVLDGQCPDTRLVRSLPAQIAVGLSPSAYYTTSESGFTGQSSGQSQRRQDSVAALRRAGSPFAAIATHRRFKSGQKGSTFPWANTVTALHDHVGRCWLASELAIIGAASKFRDGWTKTNATPFGPAAHPAVLMIESRAHKADETWWRQQRTVLHDELAHAEWALALWAVATETVLSPLLGEWESVVQQLPDLRKRALRLAIDHLTARGEATARPSAARATNLLRTLSAGESDTPEPVTPELPEDAQADLLAAVARAAKWFKVDAGATYR